MRTVIQGTPTRLRKLRQSDLPKDLDQAYLEWVDLSGLTLPRMRDADLRHYKATGTVFGDTDWTIMRDPIDLTGAKIPADVSSYNHDLVTEVITQALPRLTGVSKGIVETWIEMLARDRYAISWRNAYAEMMRKYNLTAQGAYNATLDILDSYPELLSRLAHQMTARITDIPPKANVGIDSEFRVKLQQNENARFDLFLTGTDRYLAARAIEKAYLVNRGIEVVSHIGQLDPYPDVQVVIKSRTAGEYWWSGGWPA